MKWTTEQQSIFKAQGNTLVSASAGSGKTTVMVKCIADILTKSVPIESVVVMSYTIASAADMRQKIINKLYAYAREGVDDEGTAVDVELIKRQIDNIPFADISTVDSFCSRIIRENFETLGIDPSFKQLNEEDAAILKSSVMKGLLSDLHEEGDESFIELSAKMDDTYGSGRLSGLLLKLYDAVSLSINPEAYVNDIRQSFGEGCMRRKYENIISEYYSATALDCADMLKGIGPEGFAADSRFAEWYAALCRFAEELAAAHGFGRLREVLAARPDMDLPRGRNADIDTECKLAAGRVRDVLKKAVLELERILAVGDDGDSKELIDGVLETVSRFAKRYAAKKTESVSLDFADLSRLAIRLLTDDERAREIRGGITHVFVDEYQDINALQEFVIGKIATADNLFMVGDSKQSIYAFRNADTQIFLDKAAAYERGADTSDESGGTHYKLTQNFRSTRRILEFNDRLFSVIMNKRLSGVEYGGESRFLTEETDYTAENLKELGHEVEINFYHVAAQPEEKFSGIYSVERAEVGNQRITDAYAEGRRTAEKIKETVGTVNLLEGGKVRKLCYGDVAILLRRRTGTTRRFIQGLRDGGIPYVFDSAEGTEGEIVKKTLINLLRVIDNSQNEIPFAGYLLSYFGGFSEEDVFSVKSAHEGLPLYSAVQAETKGGKHAEKCAAVLSRLTEWRAKASYKDIGSFLTDIITETGYDAYVLSGSSGRTEYAVLEGFLSSLTGKTAAGDLSGFLRFYDSTDRAFSEVPVADYSDSVRVMTIHGSKGLEFPVVFICLTNETVNKNANQPDILIDRDLGIGTKLFDKATRAKRDSLAYTAITLNGRLKAVAEDIRLMYVAMTRAQKLLFISGTVSQKAAADGLRFYKPLTQSNNFAQYLLYAAMRDTRLSLLVGDVEEYDCAAEVGARAEANARVAFTAPEETYLKAFDKVLNFEYPYAAATAISPKYTVTELNRMEEDVSAYVPSLFVTDGRARGIAYHTVMENIDLGLDTLLEVEAAIAAMVKSGVLLAEDAAMVSAEEILKCITHPIIREALKGRYFREQSFMMNLPANEVMETRSTDKVLIQGTIDLLVFGRENAVIDFKSSGAVTDTLRERYKKQLNVYVSAVETVFRVKIDKRYLYSFRDGCFLEL